MNSNFESDYDSLSVSNNPLLGLSNTESQSRSLFVNIVKYCGLVLFCIFFIAFMYEMITAKPVHHLLLGDEHPIQRIHMDEMASKLQDRISTVLRNFTDWEQNLKDARPGTLDSHRLQFQNLQYDVKQICKNVQFMDKTRKPQFKGDVDLLEKKLQDAELKLNELANSEEKLKTSDALGNPIVHYNRT